MKKQEAFTLIELLVVISVLGVLFAVLLPNMIGMRLRARDTQAKNDLRQVKAALRLYYNDYQTYPASNESGQIMGCGADGDLSCPNDDGSFAAGDIVYMKELPDDFTYYRQTIETDDFRLSVTLENPSDTAILESHEHCQVTEDGDDDVYYLCAD